MFGIMREESSMQGFQIKGITTARESQLPKNLCMKEIFTMARNMDSEKSTTRRQASSLLGISIGDSSKNDQKAISIKNNQRGASASEKLKKENLPLGPSPKLLRKISLLFNTQSKTTIHIIPPIHSMIILPWKFLLLLQVLGLLMLILG